VDRSLRLDLLELALGETRNLPSAEELAEALALAEAELFREQVGVSDDLLRTGWYLHSVGAALESLQLYGTARQRAAFQVSGHIFDLALADPAHDEIDRLRLTFASQVANLRGGLNPNAIAAYRWRTANGAAPDISFGEPAMSLALGTAILASDTPWLFPTLQRLRNTSAQAREAWEINLAETAFASSNGVVDGAWSLILYLVYGDSANRERARDAFRQAASVGRGPDDLDARWVAFHLWQIAADLGQSSPWAILPPDTSPTVTRAFTMARPPVLSLWPPQLDVLDREREPYALDPNVRRLVFSLPTSAGKTLLAQLLVADHLARTGTGVCFVAPTRSLCREIEASLRQRLRLLATASEVTFSDELFEEGGEDLAAVEVMTPERLAYSIRVDPSGTLARFGMFVIDEAHSVGERSRGWILEASLSFLHWSTTNTHHRIVAMSAALGNRATVAAWLDPAGLGFHYDSEWRGPRRVHSIFTTEKVDESATVLPQPTRRSPRRTRYDLRGVLHLRPTSTGRIFELRTQQPIGQLVVRPPGTRDPGLSTPFYRTIAPIAEILGRSGPVLVISPTKPEARSLAAEIARRSHHDGPPWLVALAEARLGANHPLVACLRRGVAYHHASLPRDVLLGIEQSVGTEEIHFVVATTTLTEGVNLPVRTVIIASQGTYGADGTYEEFITGARLLNAIGRAGRAGKESEGWIVLARNAAYQARDFERLTPGEAEMQVVSSLATTTALDELALLEAEIAANADVALTRAGPVVESFISHIWLLASIAEDSGLVIEQGIEEFLESTLAWRQLQDSARVRWRRIARSAASEYARHSSEERHRWSRSGISLPSAAAIERVVVEIARAWADVTGELDTDQTLTTLLGNGRLTRLLQLPESQVPGMRLWRTGAAGAFDLEALELLRDWVRGDSLEELASRYFSPIADHEFRSELLADYISAAFDNFLPWVLGIIVEWTNDRLEAMDAESRIPASIAGFVRYGVSSSDAAILIRSGVPSRTVATLVAERFSAVLAEEQPSLREWLCQTGIADWRAQFAASPQDLAALLEFARPRGTRLAARLLAGEAITLPLRDYVPGEWPQALDLRPLEGDPEPARLGFFARERTVGLVGPEHLTEMRAIVQSGIPIHVRLDREAVPAVATLSVATFPA
jgi:hypothetical protein